jgi:hypothetical protein
MNEYQPRPVTAYGIETISGWPVKIYGLAVAGRPTDELVTAARGKADVVLAAVAEPPRAAFVIAHQARPACFVLVYWWSTDVDLRLQYFRAPHDEPTDLKPLPTSSAGCVWELALANHERVSWIRHVLTDRPDLDGYLAEAGPEHV